MKQIFLVTIVLIALSLSACSKDETLGSAKLQVRLTDAPADYQAVYVDIQAVEVNAGENEKSGWVSLQGIRAGRYDLLKLTNGLDTLIAWDELPAGNISQIRLVLGANNSLKVKGEEIVLKTPSAEQAGLKISVNAKLQEGIIYTILLDFDAARSIVEVGKSTNYILKPVIRSILEAQSGAIKGSIIPSNAASVVYAIAGSDTVSSYTDESGSFFIKGLPAGTYKIVLIPKENYPIQTLENITITKGIVSLLEPLIITTNK